MRWQSKTAALWEKKITMVSKVKCYERFQATRNVVKNVKCGSVDRLRLYKSKCFSGIPKQSKGFSTVVEFAESNIVIALPCRAVP